MKLSHYAALLTAGLFTLGGGPAKDVAKSVYDSLHDGNQKGIERVEAVKSSAYTTLDRILGSKAHAQEIAQPTVIQVYDFATGNVATEQTLAQRLVMPNENVQYIGGVGLSDGTDKLAIGLLSNRQEDRFYAVGGTGNRGDIHQIIKNMLPPLNSFGFRRDPLVPITIRYKVGNTIYKRGIIWDDTLKIHVYDLNANPIVYLGEFSQFFKTLFNNVYPINIIAVNSENSRFTRSDGTIGYTSLEDDVLYVQKGNGRYALFSIPDILNALAQERTSVNPIEDNIDLEALFGSSPNLGPVRSIGAVNNGSLTDKLIAVRTGFSGRTDPQIATDLVNENQIPFRGNLHRWPSRLLRIYVDPSTSVDLAEKALIKLNITKGLRYERVYTPSEANVTFKRDDNLDALSGVPNTPGYFRMRFSPSSGEILSAEILLANGFANCDYSVTFFCSNVIDHELNHIAGLPGEGIADNNQGLHRKKRAIRALYYEIPTDMLVLNQRDGTYSRGVAQKPLGIGMPHYYEVEVIEGPFNHNKHQTIFDKSHPRTSNGGKHRQNPHQIMGVH